MDIDDDEKLRDRLTKLLAHLGTPNLPEAETAWRAIDALLRRYERTWADVIGIVGSGNARFVESLGLTQLFARLEGIDHETVRQTILSLLGRVDGFDQDEAADECEE
jgi:hypothetical protein